MTDPLDTIEQALATVPAADRTAVATLALVASLFGELDLDEDACHAATRRGLLLAAAAGDPAASLKPGTRAVLETAADLADDVATRLLDALSTLAAIAAAQGRMLVAAAARDLACRRVDAVEALALLLLAEEVDVD